MPEIKSKRSYKFRAKIPKKALYMYTCGQCFKKRSSRIYDRALEQVCQVCLRHRVPENQPSLFSTDEEIDLACGQAISESAKIIN